MKIALEQKGITCSRSTVLKTISRGNLLHKSRKSPDGLTKADKKAQKCEDLVKQDFSASKPNENRLTDITQIACKDGTLYIAPVPDCFAGEIISVAMDTVPVLTFPFDTHLKLHYSQTYVIEGSDTCKFDTHLKLHYSQTKLIT